MGTDRAPTSDHDAVIVSDVDERRDRYRFDFDRSVVSPSMAVVESVGAVTETDPQSIAPPLNDVVDTDALDRLFEDRPDAPRGDGHLVFYYGGCRVRLYADDTVEVERRE